MQRAQKNNPPRRGAKSTIEYFPRTSITGGQIAPVFRNFRASLPARFGNWRRRQGRHNLRVLLPADRGDPVPGFWARAAGCQRPNLRLGETRRSGPATIPERAFQLRQPSREKRGPVLGEIGALDRQPGALSGRARGAEALRAAAPRRERGLASQRFIRRPRDAGARARNSAW